MWKRCPKCRCCYSGVCPCCHSDSVQETEQPPQFIAMEVSEEDEEDDLYDDLFDTHSKLTERGN